MKKAFLLFFVVPVLLSAGRIDYVFLHKISGTKWELQAEKKAGRWRYNRHPQKETITFSEGSMLFDLPDAHYSCNYTLKNQKEFWLYCSEPDQYVYRIRRLSVTEMVVDVLFKNKTGGYTKKKRLLYHRVTT